MSAELPRTEGLNDAVVRQIKAERAASGMTIDELAEASGVGARSLVRYLNFERELKLGMIDRLARALGLTPAELLTRATNERQR